MSKRHFLQTAKAISTSAGQPVGESDAIQASTRRKLEKLGFGKGIEDKATLSGSQPLATGAGIRSTDSISEPETLPPEPSPAPAAPQPVGATVTLEDIQRLMEGVQAKAKADADAAIEKAKADAQALVDEANARIAAEKEAADTQARAKDAELQAERDRVKSLESIWTLRGEASPQGREAQPMQVLGEGSKESRQFEKLIESAPKMQVSNKGGIYTVKDHRQIDAYYRKNKTAVREGVEAVLKDKGMLAGGYGVADTQAVTLAADIPSIAFQYLSSFVRESHYPDLIFHQFSTNAVELGRRPGLNIAVPRFPYMAAPASTADRILTPGTPINPATNPVSELDVTVTLLELGLGKDASNAVLGLSTFIEAYSLFSLEQIIERNLGRDYQATKNLFLQTQFFTSDRIIYNNNDTVTTDPTSIVAGRKGTLTDLFLMQLRAYMKVLQIPSYLDGNYGLIVNPVALAQFMATQNTRNIESDDDIVANMLSMSTGNDFGGVVSGYRGLWYGFHIFEQNLFGVGAPGDVGTQTVTFGTGIGAQTCDSNFAFGRDTICWCTGMPAEIRTQVENDFGRQQRLTWVSWENAGALDVRFNASSGSQLRVLQFRNLRAPV